MFQAVVTHKGFTWARRLNSTGRMVTIMQIEIVRCYENLDTDFVNNKKKRRKKKKKNETYEKKTKQ